MTPLLVGLFLQLQMVAPVWAGNALTLPSQRHVVRIDPGDGTPPVWLAAIQQDGWDGNGLTFWRSDDETSSWYNYAPIQNDPTIDRDTADLIVVGKDIALVYSYEGPELSGSTAHDVWFQWWRYRAGDWQPQPAVRVFNSQSNQTAYSRAELARDSRGRLWVQTFRLEADGSSTVLAAVSTNGGQSFAVQPALDHLAARGGGRLLALGSSLALVYDAHDQGTPARLLTRRDADAPGVWAKVQTAFPEGIYHGAACSAVADGMGGMDLIYKREDSEALYYRHFDGSSFGDAVLLEDQSDWALQPAVTRIGDTLVVFYNTPITTNQNYEIRVRAIVGDWVSDPELVDATVAFKGYLASPEQLPAGYLLVPCLFGLGGVDGDGGWVAQVISYR